MAEFNIEELATDLSISNEMGGMHTYRLNETKDAILVDQYNNEGEIINTLSFTINIEGATNAG
ncbi:hypothetical protein PBI_CANTARE_120 [Brevibacterium phage Cantare]|uniref:Uncharacterized protein n=1 Tax=Brevibacterium phage Cantare TaxID=2338395 RepID=A0A3G3LYW6_9CAUD|nr:hypothetical protein PQD70_gp120 [Brevibacterium phage Cantare]AYQ99340.1 hypothetical protein PBI_CANTARE_120 [Brevibacterium phage Cantare]